MEALTQRREELTKKESQLQESLLKFERFLKENDAKRARAVKKSIEEKKVRELKEGEMSHLKVNLKDLSVKREKQSKCLENRKSFYYAGLIVEGCLFGFLTMILEPL